MAFKRPTANWGRVWPALFVGAMGLAWLAQTINWLPTTLPLGPISILVAALAMVYYARSN